MGNCLGSDTTSDGGGGKPNPANNNKMEEAKPKQQTHSATAVKKDRNSSASGRPSTIQAAILVEHSVDVYKKYTETEVLGNGSMGHVAKVKINDDFRGGSAYAASGGVAGKPSQAELDVDKAKAFLKQAGYEKSSEFPDSNRNSVNSSGTTSGADGSLVDTRSSTNTNNNTNKDSHYALKSIQLDRVSTTFIEELKNEIHILKSMDHPNIVKLHEVFSHRKQIYMILELCDGGDLYTKLPYTEKDSAYITGKLLSAIAYMHSHGIVHRDLKFENIMFENKSPEAEIKVIDFGLSKKFATHKLGVMREGVGTLYSMAPQVLQGVYNSQADMWSVGVISYMLLSSHRPFYNKKRKVMIDRIMRCDYTFKKDYWTSVSGEAKDFIDHLLVLDPKHRYTAKKAQLHKWMQMEFKLEDRTQMTESMVGRTNTALHKYKNNLGLKKLALNVIAHRSTTAQILNLRKAFDAFDTSNDGVISAKEFKNALKSKCDYTDDEIKDMFDAIDINQTGDIMYTEFIAATLEAQGQVDEERVAEAFDRLDADNTGYISKENIMEWLSDTDTTMADVERMINNADVDNCGQVSFEEFLSMFRGGKEGEENETESNSNTNNGALTKSVGSQKGRSMTKLLSSLTSMKHLSDEFDDEHDDDDDDGANGGGDKTKDGKGTDGGW